MKNILVIRFSAFGDVILSYHVIKAFLQQNPETKIIFLTKPFFAQIFKNENRVITPKFNPKTDKGLTALIKFGRKILKEHDFDTVIDLHNSLRSRILRTFFSFSGKRTFVIDKGKKEKRQLTRIKNKKLVPLKHTTERYADVFRKAGFKIDLNVFLPEYQIKKTENLKQFLKNKSLKKICIAPFAKHYTKTYPLEKSEKVISELNKNFNVFILGAPNSYEEETAKKWEAKYPNVFSVIGKFSLNEEIALIDSCEAIITMDSANMHLASLTKTKIISVWGATHPYLGFTPFKKFDEKLAVQKNLPCRPCSVFGSAKCYKNTLECLNIPPEVIISKVKQITG